MSASRGPKGDTDPRISLIGGLIILGVGLWFFLGRDGPGGLGLTIAGGVLAAWSVWKLVGERG